MAMEIIFLMQYRIMLERAIVRKKAAVFVPIVISFDQALDLTIPLTIFILLSVRSEMLKHLTANRPKFDLANQNHANSCRVPALEGCCWLLKISPLTRHGWPAIHISRGNGGHTHIRGSKAESERSMPSWCIASSKSIVGNQFGFLCVELPRDQCEIKGRGPPMHNARTSSKLYC
ncbi:hypothetical protein M433DRAFT_530545 [Acidomyces richmondensis BFW]|nr:hypothetical protein M433DRAFT_530545 [Acidomyces richmondensis BFW]